ncbi:MAG: hypothetical protein IKB38_00880 [Clostridia bacterium]|nr:hypothetical protein [Clostridia bacterium]
MEKAIKSLKERVFAIWDDPCAIFSVFGFVFTSLAGTLLHFLPDVADNTLVRLIAPVNESVWEHLKLIFYPYLIFMIAEYFAYGKETRGFLGAKIRGILLGEGVIVTVHYLVSGVIGKDVAWVDITLFFVGTLVAYLLPYLMIKRGKADEFSGAKAAAIFILHIVLFSVFTFMTPKLGIFLDPQTLTYGIS